MDLSNCNVMGKRDVSVLVKVRVPEPMQNVNTTMLVT